MRRFATGVALILILATVTFFLLRIGGSDVARTLLGENATPDQIAAKTAELGLDRPLPIQYAGWLSHALRGNLGTSWLSNQPVTTSILDRLPVTLSLALTSVVLTGLLSALLGVLAATRRGWIDRFLQVLAVAGFAMPGAWLALLLILLAAIRLRWLPATGYVPLAESPTGWARSLILPVLALSVSAVASTAQQVRTAMIATLDQDYVRTLRSRGLGECSVVWKHALRNAAPNALTVLSLHFIAMLGSTVVIEQIFALPGIGSLVLQATVGGDNPTVLGVVIAMVLVVVLVNVVLDLVNAALNPKVRTR
ncbi:ABC transporter permease [Actinoplanes sp. NPDC051411]|uniref:ABC transporter permease n=1 Tax=Actinoplanes sp. NPDC051411 TaxID=3155522 RepID=UPI003418F292